MQKLTALTATAAAAGLVTIFGVGTAQAQCQDCTPDTDGNMHCVSGGGPFGACVEKVLYDGSGNEIPGSGYCYVSSCDGYGWYSYTYYDYWEACLMSGFCAE